MLPLLATALLATPAPLRVSYTTVVDHHISELMPVYLNDDLNHEWGPNMDFTKILHTKELGDIAWQQYKLPWPLAPRDLVLTCTRAFFQKETYLTSTCQSVDHPAAPVAPGVVRMEMKSSAWKIEALPNEQTRISLTLEVPASEAKGVPNFVLKYIQRSSLKDSVRQLLDAVERLNLPPHEKFLRWQRTRKQGAAAAAAAEAHVPHLSSALLAALWPTSTYMQVLLVLVLLAIGHVLSFSCLASVWRRRTTATSSASHHHLRTKGAKSVTLEDLPVVPAELRLDDEDGAAARTMRRRPASTSMLVRLHGGLVM